MRAAVARGATLVCSVLVFSGCGGGEEVSLLPDDLEEIRPLRYAEFALASRPATCRRARPVMIVAGKPRPRELRLEEGECFLWGNPGDGAVSVAPAWRPQRGVPPSQSDLPVYLDPRAASETRGPVAVLSRREARGLRPAGQTLSSFSAVGVSELATRAFSPERGRPRPLQCPARMIPAPRASERARFPYTVRPGGARGTIISERSRKAADSPSRATPGGLAEISRLSCGKRTIAERPAGCRATLAVVVAGGRPRPSRVRLRRGGGCIIWGNRDRSERTVTFDQFVSGAGGVGSRRLWPRAAVAWDFFYRARPGVLGYSIQPSDVRGTIVLE